MRYLLMIGLLGYFVLFMLYNPRTTYACSISFPTLGSASFSADVIAIGTITKSEDFVATVEVETYLKGDVAAPTLTVNNHEIWLISLHCETSTELIERFPVGTRLLLFLVPDQTKSPAVWQPEGLLMETVWVIKNDSLIIESHTKDPDRIISLDEAINIVTSRTQTEPFTPQPQVLEPTKLPVLSTGSFTEINPSTLDNLPIMLTIGGVIVLLIGIQALAFWLRSRDSV